MEILLEELFQALDRVVPTLEGKNNDLITVKWDKELFQAYPLIEPNIVAWVKTSLPTENIHLSLCWKLLSGMPKTGKCNFEKNKTTRTIKITTNEFTKTIDYCDDAPEPPKFVTPANTTDTIHAEDLNDTLKRCMLICKDEAREAISGLCLSDIHGVPCMVATDGSRMTVGRLKMFSGTSRSPETVIPYGELYKLQSFLETAPSCHQPIKISRSYENTIISYDNEKEGAQILFHTKNYAEWKKIMPNPECTMEKIHIQLTEYERLKLEQTIRLFLMFKDSKAEQYTRVNFGETMELEIIETIPSKNGPYHSQTNYIGVGTGYARHNQKEWDEMFPTLDPYIYSNTFKLKLFHDALCSVPPGSIDLYGEANTSVQSPLYFLQDQQIQHVVMPCRI